MLSLAVAAAAAAAAAAVAVVLLPEPRGSDPQAGPVCGGSSKLRLIYIEKFLQKSPPFPHASD